MANKKRRLSNKEIDRLHNIENLLHNHSKEVKQNNKTESLKVEMKASISQNTSSNFNSIRMTPHAYERAEERFRMNRNEALQYFKTVLKKAKRIGHSRDTYGNDSILYAHGRIAIYLSTDLTEIKTVMKHESVTYDPIKNAVALLHEKEIRKLERTEKAKLRKLQNEELKVNVEIANAKLRLHKTKSESVRIACSAHIKGLEEYIGQLKEEVISVQSQKRQVCRSMVAVV